MTLVLPPFYHWLASALAFDDFLLQKLQSFQFILEDAGKQMLILRVIDANNRSSQSNVAFLETHTKTICDIVLRI
jgi:hypothetical protein